MIILANFAENTINFDHKYHILLNSFHAIVLQMQLITARKAWVHKSFMACPWTIRFQAFSKFWKWAQSTTLDTTGSYDILHLWFAFHFPNLVNAWELQVDKSVNTCMALQSFMQCNVPTSMWTIRRSQSWLRTAVDCMYDYVHNIQQTCSHTNSCTAESYRALNLKLL